MAVAGSLHPILKKHTSGKWKQLPVTGGDSIGINDPKLKQGYLGNMEKKSKVELEELLMRQDKLLSNVSFVAKLGDGGKRLKERRQQLQEALDRLQQADASLVLPDMTSLEWRWRGDTTYTSTTTTHCQDTLDSDDDDHPDPLAMLATHSYDAPPSAGKTVVSDGAALDPSAAIEKELRNLDIRDSLEDNAEGHSERDKAAVKKQSGVADLTQDFGAKMLISLEKKHEQNLNCREVFKPFRVRQKQHLLPQESSDLFSTTTIPTTNSIASATNSASNSDTGSCQCPPTSAPVHSAFGISAPPQFPVLQAINMSGKHTSKLWQCESAATGPLTATGGSRPIKLLSLRESIELQKQVHERMHAMHVEEATARLKNSVRASSIRTQSETSHGSAGDGSNLPSGKRLAYRDKNLPHHVLDVDDLDDTQYVGLGGQLRDQDSSSESAESSDEDVEF